MRHLLLSLLCVALASHLPAQSPKDKEKEKEGRGGFVSLFDGKTLAGWKGRAELWSVRDGAIAGSTKPQGINFNTFLISEKEYGDFILKLKFKYTGGNSGIQFRSRQTGEPARFVVSGFQADIGEGYTGALYDEARRNKLLARPEESVLKKAFKKDDWNDYEIRAVGKQIELLLNGVTTVKYEETDPGIATRGVLALQLHGGPAMEVLFRDLQIKELPPAGK